MQNNRFEWGNEKCRQAGNISIGKDKDGLPVLHIEVDDDHYSGTLTHERLFRLMTALAMRP